MKNLIKIQAVIENIEETTLEKEYHSTFNYINERTMVVNTFCWEQTYPYKTLFDHMKDVVIYIQGNSIIKFIDLSEV